MSSIAKTAKWMGTAGVITATVAFLPMWEGTDHVAKRDVIGTGHPITACHGQTPADVPGLKVGQSFTDKECDEMLAKSLPKYLERLDKCIKVPLPVESVASLLDASYNAGTGAVCKSPMLAKMNSGDIRGGCEAFEGWYVRSDGQVRKGLVARRSGIGDGRESERDKCLKGLKQPKSEWYIGYESGPVIEAVKPPDRNSDGATPRAGCGRDGISCPEAKPTPKKFVPHKKHQIVCTGAWFWKECK